MSYFVKQPWNTSIITNIIQLYSPLLTSSLKPIKGTAPLSRRDATKIVLKNAILLKFTMTVYFVLLNDMTVVVKPPQRVDVSV